MSNETEKEIELLALGYAVGGRGGMSWVAYAILIKMLLPVIGFIVALIVVGAQEIPRPVWGILEMLGLAAIPVVGPWLYIRSCRKARREGRA